MSYMTALCRFMMLASAILRWLFHVGDTPTSGKASHRSPGPKPSPFLHFGLLRALTGLSSVGICAADSGARIQSDYNAKKLDSQSTAAHNKNCRCGRNGRQSVCLGGRGASMEAARGQVVKPQPAAIDTLQEVND